MSDSHERLYALLPAIDRQRDMEAGQPLRALLAVVEAELRAIEADIAGLYENWFIETCDEWAVPYIGDLLGVSVGGGGAGRAVSRRALVANVIGYRRRKGTARALEQVAADVTGWGVRAVESNPLLAATQHVQAARPGQGTTAAIRDAAALHRLGTAFETTPRRPDVRTAPEAARANLGTVRLFIWRLQSFPVTAPARPLGDGRFTLSPLGADAPLFRRPIAEGDARDLPERLTRRTLADDILAGGALYGPEGSLHLVADGEPIPARRIIAADLSAWQPPPVGSVAVDVELGRVAFAAGEAPSGGVQASYRYGFAAPIGGGSYDRRGSLADTRDATWRANVRQGAGPDDSAAGSLGAALRAWEEHARTTAEPRGVIRILDSAIYAEPLSVALPPDAALTIEADDGARPAVVAGAPAVSADLAAGATLTLSGLLLEGAVALRGGGRLVVRHCTAPAGITADALAAEVLVESSLVGPLVLGGEAAGLTVRDSVVDGRGVAAVAGRPGEDFGPPAELERATILGRADVRQLSATDCIFAGPLRVERRQAGMMRFCYAPPGSETPRRYRCQPDFALESAEVRAQRERGRGLSDGERAALLLRVRPHFTAERYGDPGYAQLRRDTPGEIAAGAESGAEMGAFHDLRQPQREAELRAVLDEYLPIGMAAALTYVS